MAAHIDYIVAAETMAATWIGSPRISFSQDLIQHPYQEDDGGQKRERMNEFSFHGSSANSDFDFCVSGDECAEAHQLSATADLLFSDGKILPISIPIPIQTQHHPSTAVCVPPTPTTTAITLDKTRKKSSIIEYDEEHLHDKSAKTAFWKFGRSSSLHMSNILCSSLTLLSRSKSTGSYLDSSSSRVEKQHQQKKNSGHKPSTAASSLSRGKQLPKMTNGGAPSTSYYYTSCHGNYGNNGVRISPILNVPYMPKGIGHLLGRRKNKSRNKHMLNC